MNKIFIFTIGIIISIFECQNDFIQCGNFTCVKGNGICKINGTIYDCECTDFYDSYPKNDTIKCNYQRKKQSVAFLLETFISYGAGHFYSENYQFAVPKMFFWVVCYCLFIYLKMLTKTNEENNTTALIVTLLACLFLSGMLAWQLADIILYGINIYQDGNGINLLPWSIQPQSNSEY